MTKTEFFLTLSTSDENKENISKGIFLDDPITNSPNEHHMNCIGDNKENY